MAIEIVRSGTLASSVTGASARRPSSKRMLLTAGAVTRLGKVDDGTTTTDFDPDEIKRKISINTAVGVL